MQHEITERIPLLDGSGNLTQPGYAKKLLPVYRRADIKAGKLRIKEWDYYLINNGRFALALTVDDNGYMGLDSISLLDFENGWEITNSPMSFMPLGKLRMPETSAAGDVSHGGKKHLISFKHAGPGRRVLDARMDNFGPAGAITAHVELFDEPDESMVICTPFDKPGHFYYNQKINCMRAEGEVSYNGVKYVFDPSESFAVLDWGRGVWTYHNTWYWGSASYHVDSVPFGWNIGYGFGDCSAASENMLFYNGKAHKLSQVKFNIPGNEKDFMSPWTFTSDDGRFEMDFVPVLDRAACTDVKLIKSDQHQVFGRFTGKAVLDDGTVIEVRDFPGFAEKVENKW
ncbi:MAG: DUF2804 domain-containing protein [Candidatus Limivicinus sp.]|nr:DUF2804 domain-containing protein [Candidatus Limivicinus sp.]